MKNKLLFSLMTFIVIISLGFGSVAPVHADNTAMPMDPTDDTKVPHYFGPYPNWANSPFTLPDAQVVIIGNGSGAEAVATVGADGAITEITVTNPGHDYSNARVEILGSGTGATADTVIVKKGAVIGVTMADGGTGYTAPTVSFSGNGGASGLVYGGVENNIQLTYGGFGYEFPTVDFDMPDLPDGTQAKGHVEMVDGVITAVVVDDPGSGYLTAPKVVVRDGTLFDPIRNHPNGFAAAIATTTLTLQEVVLDTFGSGYNQVPDVIFNDPTGSGAAATAAVDNGVISSITIKRPGSGYITPGGIRKFVDTLPGLGPDAANNLGQYIPVGEPDTTTFADTDYYEIGVVEYQEKLHSDLPPTTLRGYVQLETATVQGIHYPLPNGKFGVDKPHYLGPTIVAARNRPVRITFYNLLPNGAEGDLFLPVDTTMMGSGAANMDMIYDPMPVTGGNVLDEARNPMCSEKFAMPGMRMHCFTENRATLHLHGGNVPWISDGTPHQWITPAGEDTMWPQGVSVQSVPDMVGQGAIDAGIPDCSAENDGCMTFYYTNQQSARLMFYHDHSWGITRLNVYAGEAAGYLLTDDTEQTLMAPGGALETVGLGIPLIVQDKTFVPQDEQLSWQDPTWDASRWGGYGNFWYHHVYMPAQNPGDPSGMSAYGRWMYSPWFWPPASDTKHGPIANPYYDMDPLGPDQTAGTEDDWTSHLAVPCNLDDPSTWQYDTDPYCEPEFIPGTPNISVGMEQFNDTPLVNGTAYPTVTLNPTSYRFRVLNAANDRFFNFQWYVADSTGTEVALKASEVAAAQLDPVVFPTPDLNLSPAGPDWIQIGTESGFLPAPVVIDGQQVTTWITDPTRFDVGNVDKHSLLLAPAERADVVVDFSQFAGKTLILYNDAPAAFPARIPSYDYYTGAPDLRPVGAPPILPGYGPNTRTIMQVKIANTTPTAAFNLTKLRNAFSHKADGSGVFESGQHPIVVGQAGYNSAYGTSFAASGWCSSPNSSNKCDGYARISQQGGDLFTFDTLQGATTSTWSKLSIPLEPKAIQDETSEMSFDEYGRMMAILGLEVVPATPGLQNMTMLPYVYSATELIDTTRLPKADVEVMPIGTADDGTQIWKITHNGVDTHPIHFHATDVQLLNRVTWDNIIIPPDANELGWKETVRVAPLEDTIVAMRPVTPTLPFDFPNSIRLMSPMMPDGAAIDLSSIKDALGLGMSAFAPNGEPIDVYNHYVNYGAEYVYHCHILSHEEMDMMRAVLFAFPPVAPSGLAFDPLSNTVSWTDNSHSETAFVIEKSSDGGVTWDWAGQIDRPLAPGAGSTTGEVETFTDPDHVAGDQYRVFAQNTVGDTWDYSDPNLNELLSGGFPTITTKSDYATIVEVTVPAAPTDLIATPEPGPQVRLNWVDNATDETGFVIERSDNGAGFVQLTTLGTDAIEYVDTSVQFGNLYEYRVAAANGAGSSGYSNVATVDMLQAPPAAPSDLALELLPGPQVELVWVDNASDESGFVIERSDNGGAFAQIDTAVIDSVMYVDLTVMAGNTYTYRVAAVNSVGPSAYSNEATVSVAAPNAPSNLSATDITRTQFTLNWQDNSDTEAGFEIQVSTNNNFSTIVVSIPDADADTISAIISGLSRNTRYFVRMRAFNDVGVSEWSPVLNVRTGR